MLFNLKLTAEKSIKSTTKQNGFVIFILDNLKKSELNKNLDNYSLVINETLFKKYNDKKITSFHANSTDKKVSFVKIVKIKKDKLSADTFRNELAGLIQSLREEHIDELSIATIDPMEVNKIFTDDTYYFQTYAEGILLGNYNFDNYKSEQSKPAKLDVKFITNEIQSAKKGITTAINLINAVKFTKDLVNEPAITLTPKELAKRTKAELTKEGVKVTVFNKKQLKEKNMNAILSVGSASPNDPCLIIMRYKPKAKAKKKIALVGKGVTYDTGGLSIKPTSGMIDMKADMAGAAATIGIMKAAAKFKLPYEIIGIVPAVENTISGNAYKPGDVVKTASGKSIEVKDTDAEGRIILADALEYASKQNPDEIIDFATLTGSIMVALGEYAAGIFTNDDSMADDLYKAGMRTYERVWRLPFWDDYNKLIKSDIADVSNLGPRWGGAITAGKFLENFVDKKIPWVHIDIAGVALANDLNNYTKKWHPGFGVRLIIDYLQNR